MTPGEQSLMNVAIFYDAAAVAGDEALLVGEGLSVRAPGRQQRVPCPFAQAIDLFETPLGFFSTFVAEHGSHDHQLDLKKGGIFH